MSRTVAGYVGDAIRNAREDLGATQTEVAEALGLRPPSVNKIENTEARIQVERLVQIAVLLGVEPADLLPTLEQARAMIACSTIVPLRKHEGPTGADYVAAVVDGAREYLSALGRPPTTTAGDATAYVGFETSWVAIDTALRKGWRGCSPGGSLRDLLVEHGVLLVGGALEDAIEAAARKFLAKHKRRPHNNDGPADEYIGFETTWSGLNGTLINGWRETTQFCALSTFLDSRGVPKRLAPESARRVGA